MKYPISLDALEVLDMIARKGSFAAAAEDLHRVPSALSYAMQKLEQDLDVLIFRKEGRRSVLTDAGKLLLEQGRELLQASERLAIATKTTHNGWEPVFNIAIDSLLNFEFIYPLIEKFYALHPSVEINLYEEVLGGSLEAISSRRTDLVIGVGDDLMPAQGIKSQCIGEIEWLFVVSPQHPLTAVEGTLTLADMELHRFVVVRDSARNQTSISRRVFNQRAVLSVPTVAEKITALKHGLGIGFLPAHRIQQEIAQGQLLALDVENANASKDKINLAWKLGNKGKVLHWFIEELMQLTFPC